MGNDLGDSFASQVKFFDPVNTSLGRWELPIEQKKVAINLTDLKSIGSGTLPEQWDRKNTGGTLATTLPITNAVGESLVPGGNNPLGRTNALNTDLAWAGASAGLSSNTPLYRALSLAEMGARTGDFVGGVEISYRDNGGAVFRKVQYRSYAIDESGNILNLGRLLEKSPLEALSDYAFRSLQEIQVTSDGFKGDIDVVSKLLRLSNVSKQDDRL